MKSPIVTGLLAATLAIALVGCSDEDDPISLPSPTEEAAGPSPSAEPSPSPSASPSDPFAVPDDITADYVERVLNEINRLDAELVKDLLRRPLDEGTTELPDDDRAALAALFEEPHLTTLSRASLDLLRSSDERNDLLPPDEMTQFRTEIEEVLTPTPCVVARGRTDLTGIDAEVNRETPILSFYFLVREEPANTTGWKLAAVLEGTSGGEPVPEEELRAVSANDLSSQFPEVCQ